MLGSLTSLQFYVEEHNFSLSSFISSHVTALMIISLISCHVSSLFQLFSDVLLPSKSKWANIFYQMVKMSVSASWCVQKLFLRVTRELKKTLKRHFSQIKCDFFFPSDFTFRTVKCFLIESPCLWPLALLHPEDPNSETRQLPRGQAGSGGVPLCQADTLQSLSQSWVGRLG